MSSWFSRVRAPKPSTEEADRLQLPEDLWSKCPACAAIIYSKELARNMSVCPKCGYHFGLSPEQRINLLCDRATFEEFDRGLESHDPLNFRDSARYKERLKENRKKTGDLDAARTGRGKIHGTPVMFGVLNLKFMGGSMGTVVGEKLARIAESARSERTPLVIVSSSGGARMQEGILSLMQMAKVTAALVRLNEAGLPYVSILANPTTGGVAASFAMLGDINISEPGALIGFAGARVIEQTIKKKLPEGFQKAEFLLERGMIDMIVERAKLKDTLAQVLDLMMPVRI